MKEDVLSKETEVYRTDRLSVILTSARRRARHRPKIQPRARRTIDLTGVGCRGKSWRGQNDILLSTANSPKRDPQPREGGRLGLRG